MPAEHDGDFQNFLYNRYLWKTSCCKFYTDSIPLRRIISHALGISPSKIRVTKPRIGGGFGAKQTSVSEIYPAFVTWKTKKPSKIIFSREETQSASSPRHEMQMHVRLGATKDGIVKGIDLYTLSNTGAYGEHGPTTVGLLDTSQFHYMERQRRSVL